jgi:hypothetical protein
MNEISSKQYSKDEVDRIIFRCKKIWPAKIGLRYPNPEKASPTALIA